MVNQNGLTDTEEAIQLEKQRLKNAELLRTNAQWHASEKKRIQEDEFLFRKYLTHNFDEKMMKAIVINTPTVQELRIKFQQFDKEAQELELRELGESCKINESSKITTFGFAGPEPKPFVKAACALRTARDFPVDKFIYNCELIGMKDTYDNYTKKMIKTQIWKCNDDGKEFNIEYKLKPTAGEKKILWFNKQIIGNRTHFVICEYNGFHFFQYVEIDDGGGDYVEN